jgi:hypothetical protein
VDDEARLMTSVNGIRDIDFWRRAVLIVILIDHIPGNPLEHFTPRNFGLSDSAEAFVFLSGLSAGLIYLPRACEYGFGWRLPQASDALIGVISQPPLGSRALILPVEPEVRLREKSERSASRIASRARDSLSHGGILTGS